MWLFTSSSRSKFRPLFAYGWVRRCFSWEKHVFLNPLPFCFRPGPVLANRFFFTCKSGQMLNRKSLRAFLPYRLDNVKQFVVNTEVAQQGLQLVRQRLPVFKREVTNLIPRKLLRVEPPGGKPADHSDAIVA